MAGGPHDNYNLIQFRLDQEQVARVDAHLIADAQRSGKLTSRNAFCKRVLCEALEQILSPVSGLPSPATPVPAPAE